LVDVGIRCEAERWGVAVLENSAGHLQGHCGTISDIPGNITKLINGWEWGKN
jgi:hypothetical protein